MGSDEIAAIHPAIVEVLEAPGAERDWCATFEVSGHPDLWIQFTPGLVNMAYPHSDDPAQRLRALGWSEAQGLHVDDRQPGRSATFRTGELSSRDLARLIDRLFVTVLGCEGSEYPVDVEVFRTASMPVSPAACTSARP